MRVFLVHMPMAIPPLDAPARDAWLLDCTLGQRMEGELRSAGLEIERSDSFAQAEEMARKEPGGAFILADSVACSRSVLRRFVKTAQRTRGQISLICALPRATATNSMSYVDGLNPAFGIAPHHKAWTAPFYFLRGDAHL